MLASTAGLSSQAPSLSLTLSFCFSVSRLLSSSRSYRVISTFLSQSLMRRGNSVSSVSRHAGMTARHTQGSVQHLDMQPHTLDTQPQCPPTSALGLPGPLLSARLGTWGLCPVRGPLV